MSGTIKRPIQPHTAPGIPDPAAYHRDLETPIASVPVHDGEAARDPRDTLTMTSNLDSFLHRNRR